MKNIEKYRNLIAKGEAEAVYVLTLGAASTLTLNGEAIDF
mgnify:FL=1